MKFKYSDLGVILLASSFILASVCLVTVDQMLHLPDWAQLCPGDSLSEFSTRVQAFSVALVIVLALLCVIVIANFLINRKKISEPDQACVKSRREITRDLEKKYSLFHLLMDSSPDLIFYKDIAGTYLGCNRAFEEFVNMTEKDIIGKTDWDLFSQEEAESFRENDQQMLTQGEARHNEEWISYEDGRRLLLDTLKTPFFDETENVIGLLGISRDITERKNAERELKRAAAIKSEFTSMVSHELRTPLAVVIEAIKIVADGSCGELNPEQVEYLSVAERNVDRLGRLINDVLDVQKLESGMMEFDLKEHDINELIISAMEPMRSIARRKGLTLVSQLDPDMPRIKFDSDKIIQVVTNLLNNSIKFTESGCITVTTEKGSNYLKVSISDTGPGIKKEDMSKLFGKFEQIFKEEGKRPEGTGLGLAICREIINRHSGTIWAKSEFGKGSVFSFVLPVVERRGKGA